MGGRRSLVPGMTGPILVTGGSGQLATALAQARPDRVVVVGRPVFDFDRPETIAAAVETVQPAMVINAAAWTAVDAAEANPEAAARANTAGPRLLAESCRARGIPLIHISTDYVFDGTKGAPYTEDDSTCPTGIYGLTKRDGETAVLAAHPEAVILRTSWVYATIGRNFVITMLNAAARAPRLRVVADQVGNPTNVDDLAAATLAVCDRIMSERDKSLGGIYHATGDGATTWHGLAVATLAEAARHGWKQPPVDPITTQDWPTPARRPPDSRLDCSKLALTFGVRLPAWQPSLASAVSVLCGRLQLAGTQAG